MKHKNVSNPAALAPPHSLARRRFRVKDAALRTLIYLCAFCTVAVLAAILGHILWNGLPHISWEFLSSTYSASRTGSKGILPMIINTIYVVAITLLIAVPIGVCCAVYLTQYAKKGRLVKAIRFATEVLSGIPSIIFGLFGYAVFCISFQLQYSILAGCLTMAICILPTIVRTTEEALIAVPQGYLEGAMALGASKLRVIFFHLAALRHARHCHCHRARHGADRWRNSRASFHGGRIRISPARGTLRSYHGPRLHALPLPLHLGDGGARSDFRPLCHSSGAADPGFPPQPARGHLCAGAA